MDRRGYLALVLREATALVNEDEAALRSALAEETGAGGEGGQGGAVGAGDGIERRLASALVGVDSLEDVLRHSGLRDIPPECWRGASTWQEALTGAAMAALAHDVRARARGILEGAIPRLDNIQTG